MRQELVFKDNILQMAEDVIRQITAGAGPRVVVGVHARSAVIGQSVAILSSDWCRRGDKLRVWRQQSYIRDILGSYEGRYFRHCMQLLRRRHGEVVFIVASDDVAWARAELVTAAHNDTFLSADFVPDNTSKSAKGNLCFYF